MTDTKPLTAAAAQWNDGKRPSIAMMIDVQPGDGPRTPAVLCIDGEWVLTVGADSDVKLTRELTKVELDELDRPEMQPVAAIFKALLRVPRG